MHYRNRLIFGQDMVQTAAIRDIANLKGAPLYRPLVTINEIIVGHWAKSGLPESFTGVAANIARATCDYHNLHNDLLDDNSTSPGNNLRVIAERIITSNNYSNPSK